ncbi:MAG: T9SS type A sorting domain-containing protein [candidate division WOR-3 bacterium]
MHNILTSLGYGGLYSTTLPTTDLDVYRAILVCVGIFPNNYVIGAGSPEATALVNYVNNGGRLYLEGGDVWCYDPLWGGYDFCPLFGINPDNDGGPDLGPIQGQSGTFTNQMYFNYAGENNYMDHISPSGGGAFLIFVDVDNAYNCAVARDAGTYRTVGTSFELGALVDGSGVSTRAALLDSILHFFGIFQTPVFEGNVQKDIQETPIQVKPNPFRNHLVIQYPQSTMNYALKGDEGNGFSLALYDATGQRVKDLTQLLGPRLSNNQITWDGTDDLGRRLPGGIYFIHLRIGNQQYIQKVVKIK